MQPTLTLYEDTFVGGGAFVEPLPAQPRMIYIVHGSVTIEDHVYTDGETWHGQGAAVLQAGKFGATIWRWELSGSGQQTVAARGVRTLQKLSAVLDTLPEGELLLRGDSVAFGPGGCAYRHVHQGPGIRCLVEGGIRIDVDGTSTS